MCFHLFMWWQWTAADYNTSDSRILPYWCQRNFSSLGLPTTGVRAAVPALVPRCMPKSTNTFMNFGHLCQKKMSSPSGGDGRQPIHCLPHWLKSLWQHLHHRPTWNRSSLCGWLTVGRRNRLSKNLEIRMFLKMN